MLEEAIKGIESVLLSREAFHPFPKYGEAGWKALPAEAVRTLSAAAETLNEKEWPVLPAVRYMDFVKNGNRSRYQEGYFERRTRLRQLVIAECAEGKGRFLEQIINGIWAVCEETTWCLPAHLGKKEADDALADIENDRPVLDLFAAETGALLAWIYYLMGEKLRGICRQVPSRMTCEIERQVLKPYLERNDFWWMGLAHDRPVNNWNPWINENVLGCALTAARDEADRLQIVRKAARSVDRFLHFYAPDGGCDEGPGYFNVAGVSVLDVLEQFFLATEGKVNLFCDPLIRNMADYIRHMHIADDYFVNFADAGVRHRSVSEDVLLRAAQRSGNRALADFARMRFARNPSLRPEGNLLLGSGRIYRDLAALFSGDGSCFAGAADVASPGHWFGGIQVATARTKENSFGGLFLAAKGGCNEESHNHNDLGNYIIFADGCPAVVDAGVGVYSRKTFSAERYDIWSMQSSWHNTAVVNGCDQLPGREHAASDVQYRDDGRVMRLDMELKDAWGAEAGIESFRREFTFDRILNRVTVRDRVKLTECSAPVRLPILCAEKPEIGEGTAKIGGLLMRFDPALFTAEAEEKPLLDQNLEKNWGKPSLWRLMLTRRVCAGEDEWMLAYGTTASSASTPFYSGGSQAAPRPRPE